MNPNPTPAAIAIATRLEHSDFGSFVFVPYRSTLLPYIVVVVPGLSMSECK
jgi:hypothetical protein